MERTPILSTFQIEGTHPTTTTGSASTNSDASSPMTPVFSRTSSTSSSSSYGLPIQNHNPDDKDNAVHETSNVLGGLVSMDSSSSKYSSVPASPSSPSPRSRKFRFSFGSVISNDATPTNASPTTLAGFDFGLDSPADDTVFDAFKVPAEDKQQQLRRSISLNSFDAVRKAPHMDIYAAMQLLPGAEVHHEEATIEDQYKFEAANVAAPAPSLSPMMMAAGVGTVRKTKGNMRKRLSLRLWG
jgi:hypothetical protein